MQVTDFKIGSTYKIKTRDWETPCGEIITGKEFVKTILDPASKDNTLLDGEIPPESVIAEWQQFLRVKCREDGKIHFLSPRTISEAEILKTELQEKLEENE